MQAIIEKARALGKTIVLPEGEEPRTLVALRRIVGEGIARPILLGDPARIRAVAESAGVVLPGDVPLLDPRTDARREAFGRTLFGLRRHRGMTEAQAFETVAEVLYFGDLLVRSGEADGCVAGAVHASADVLRAAIHTLGVAPGSALVSSFFLMVLTDGRALTFADCGVVVRPSPEELASIGLDAARSHAFLTGDAPRVAFLSFSTRGSAEHEEVLRVRRAVEIARERRPDLALDGELQFDAAFVPDVGARKAPGSAVAGRANVFVFPDLNAGNIGYKIAQRVGGAEAYGPVLQGLSRPANDLSRGASADDIVSVVAITALQAGALEGISNESLLK